MSSEEIERRLDDLERRLERIEARLGIVVFSRCGPGTWSDVVQIEPQEEPAPEPAPAAVAEPDEEHWLQIKLAEDDGTPRAGERYRVELPDGRVIEGRLDRNGMARVENIDDPGSAVVTFPDMEGQERRTV